MQKLSDATSLIERPRALAERLADHGYVFLRSLLPIGEVAAVRHAMLGELTHSGWVDGEGRPVHAAVNEGDDDYFPVYRRIQSIEAFHELAHHRVLVQVAEALLDAQVLVHPRKIARMTFPENPLGTTPPHQDYPLIQGTADVLTYWIPLGDCPQEMGGLKVLSGSHQDGLRTGRPSRAVGHVGVDIPEGEPAWASTDYRMGDVLVFHSLTVHGARPNGSSHLRLSADFRYQSADEPVVDDSRHPHHHPKVPDWPELTREWASMAPVDVPAGLGVVPWVTPTEPLLPGPSRFTTAGDEARPGVVVP